MPELNDNRQVWFYTLARSLWNQYVQVHCHFRWVIWKWEVHTQTHCNQYKSFGTYSFYYQLKFNNFPARNVQCTKYSSVLNLLFQYVGHIHEDDCLSNFWVVHNHAVYVSIWFGHHVISSTYCICTQYRQADRQACLLLMHTRCQIDEKSIFKNKHSSRSAE